MQQNNGVNGNGLHILMFPFLAYGHISPFIQLSRKLTAANSDLRITFLTTPANVPRISSLFSSSSSSSPSSISITSLPLPSVPGLPTGIESTTDLTMAQSELLKTAVDNMKPDVASLLSRLRPNFIVFDFAMPWIPTVAHPLGVRSLFFSVFSAVSTAYLTVPSRRHCGNDPAVVTQELMKPPSGFPATSSIAAAGGVPAYQAQDFSYIFKSFGGQPCVYDRVMSCMTDCTAIIAKTCKEMERQYINYVEAQHNKPMLLAGPVVPEPASGQLEKRWAHWLAKFEEGSVIYCSFGSETFLTEEAIRELLLGLEMTKLPFFVVLNDPEGEEAMRKKLPEGLQDRVRDRGVIHQGWVQQQLILSHNNVGCYVNHGGFSSVVEGLVAGCQLVMVPQRGDQYLNSALFAGDLGIGVEVERQETTGDLTKDAVCEAVMKVMKKWEKKDEGEEKMEENQMKKWEKKDEGEERMEENQRKWREFFVDKGVEERFIGEFIQKLKSLAFT